MPQLGLHEAGLAAPLLAGQQGDEEVLQLSKPGKIMMTENTIVMIMMMNWMLIMLISMLIMIMIMIMIMMMLILMLMIMTLMMM